MRLIDDSPAMFLTMCFVVLYVVVGIEAAMLISGSMAILVVTFLMVASVAAGICAWMMRLLDDGAPTHVVAKAVPAPAPVPEPALVPARQRALPRPAGRLVHS